MSFSANLVNALNIRNMNPLGLSARTGIPEGEIDTYIRADIEPDPPTLEKISSCLNLKVADLCKEDGLGYSTFGEELMELRKAEGISRQELADMIGSSYQVLSKVETNRTKPKKEISDKLMDLYGQRYSDLLKKYPDSISKIRTSTIQIKPDRTLIVQPKTEEDIAKGKAYGKAIKEARKNLGITIDYTAHSLGISGSTLCRIEKGAIPKGTLYEDIKRVLGVDLNKVHVQPTKTVVPVKQPEIVVEQPRQEVSHERHFEPKWAELLSYIEDDSEYRTATSALFKWIFDGTEPKVTGPQASMVLRMIQSL